MAASERRGILILGAAALLFSLFSLTGKAVSDEISASEMVVIRSAIICPVLAIWARRLGQPWIGKRRGALFLRGFFGSIALFAYFTALKRLPLGDTVLIFQAHPLVVAALSPWILGERNGRLQWALLGVSVLSVGLVVGPTGAGDWVGRLAALTSCLMASFAYLLVRFLRRTEPVFTIAVSFPAVSFLMFAPPFFLRLPGFAWVWPDARDWIFLGAMSLTASLGQVLLTIGLGRVPAARGTALSNLQVAFALLYGIAFFDEIPTWITLVGAVVLVLAQVILAAQRPMGHDRRVGT